MVHCGIKCIIQKSHSSYLLCSQRSVFEIPQLESTCPQKQCFTTIHVQFCDTVPDKSFWPHLKREFTLKWLCTMSYKSLKTHSKLIQSFKTWMKMVNRRSDVVLVQTSLSICFEYPNTAHIENKSLKWSCSVLWDRSLLHSFIHFSVIFTWGFGETEIL